jgi:hypothetical protein
MNHTKSVFLINDHVRAILAIYDEGQKPSMFKTLDDTIMKGDLIVVPTDTRVKMTVCRVVETDVDVDFDDPAPMHWVVERISTSAHEKTLQEEAQAVAAIKSAELRQKRDSLRKAMFADHIETLKALPISSIDDAPTKA